MSRPKWTDESMALTWKVIHLQDVLLTSLGIGIREIKNQEYDSFRRVFLDIITRTTDQLQTSVDDILDLRRGPGKPAMWYTLAEDTEALVAKTRRGMELIKTKDIRRNDWDIIQARLEECKRQFQEIQARTIRALPKESHPNEPQVSQRSILDVFEMVKTFEMGDGQFRWRRSRD